MQKTDSKIVKELFEKNGLIMLGEYERYSKGILAEKDGYKFLISYKGLLNNQNYNLFGKRNPYQKENITKLIKKINPEIEFVDVENVKKSGKSRVIVKMKCSCGNLFSFTLEKITYNKYLMCNKCSTKLKANTRKKGYNEKYKKNIESQGFTMINPNQNIYALERVEVIENSTGYRGFICPFGKVKNMLTFSLEHNKSNFIYNTNVVIKSHGYKTEALELVDNNTKILAKCECGKIYKANMRAFYNGNCLCPKCSLKMSDNERKIRNFLEEHNIDFIQEFIINSCRDKHPLPFDFCLNKLNKMIEVDGEHHEKPIAFDGNYENAIKNLEIQQKHDKIKNEYCKKYNIPLLRISYEEIENKSYKEKLSNFIYTV